MRNEVQLQQLAALCGQCFGLEQPRRPALSDTDPETLLLLARRHRVQGLCWSALEQEPGPIARHVALSFAEDRRAIAAHGLRALAVSRELTDSFAAAGVPLLFLKGLAVGQLAYRDPFLKMSSDVDILIRPADLEHAARLLNDNGYAPLTPSGAQALARWHERAKESVWVRRGSPPVELHTRLADNPRLLNALDPFAGAPQLVEVAPGLRLATLRSRELHAYLAVHGASSAWFRLKWLCDFAALLAGKTADEVETLHDHATGLGAGRASAWALLLCDRLFGTAGPSVTRLGFADDRANRRLLKIGMRQLTDPREPTGHLFGTAGIHLAQLFLGPGPGFAAGEAVRQLNAAWANRTLSNPG